MSWLKAQSFRAHLALAVVVGFVIGMSAEVLADTVYTWTTEDGTVAYTDEDKRVPAKYRDQVQVKVMDGLDGYHRFTPVEAPEEVASVGADASTVATGDGVATAPGTVRVAPTKPGVSVISGGSRYGSGGVIVPTDSGTSDEPIVIEKRRVKRSDSMATTHETVVRQGDRVISIRRDESSQRDGTGMVPPLGD